jgi:tetratricopeptide (TPR) repeat protein
MRIAFFVAFAWLFCSLNANAQTQLINPQQFWSSLNSGSSNSRIIAAKKLRIHYSSESFDTLRVVGETLFFHGIDEHYPPAIEYGKIILAEYFVNSGRITDGIGIAKGIIPALQERGDNENLSDNFRIIANGYKNLGDGNSAYLWAKKAIEVNKKNPDINEQIKGLPLLAEAFLLQGKANKALDVYADYIKKATKVKDYRRLSSAYSRVGDILRIQNKIDEAASYFQLALQAAKKTGLTTPIAHAINNLAITHFEQGDTLKAKEYFFKSYELRKKTSDYVNICESLFNIGEFYYYTNQTTLALKWYDQSRELAKQKKILQAEIDALKCMATVCKDLNDYKTATQHLDKVLQLHKTIKESNASEHESLTKLQFEVWKADFDYSTYERKDKQQLFIILALVGLSGILLFTTIWLWMKIRRGKTQNTSPSSSTD